MNPEEQDERDELWELLGKAKAPSVSPYFARNILREVRKTGQGGPLKRMLVFLANVRRSLSSPARIALVGGLAAAAAVGTMLVEQREATHKRERQDIVKMAEYVPTSADFQVINHLDELMDSEKDTVWLDNAD